MVLAHQLDRLGLEHAVAVERAAIEQHAHEADVVGRGAVEPAAAHVEFRLLRHLERHRRSSDPSAPRCVHADEALALRRAELKSGVVHAERREDVILEIDIEALAARGLDALPTQSMLMPYSQRSPGSKASGRVSALFSQVVMPGMPACSM